MSTAERHKVSAFNRRHARHMRVVATDAERAMWLLLRDRRLQGFKFRRQVPF
ncbi:MAG TPA: DUF559 domain-containing protein, partial [Xanthobacteraceae bacterium]|nr:DUF559 domain-containing protein [Xanthobacteraceae bacterium]